MSRSIILILLFLVTGCGNQKKKEKESASKIYFPYEARYSEGFELGEKELVKKVQEVWRAYDRGNLSSIKDHLADHLSMSYPGLELKGTRDSVINSLQKERDQYSNIQTWVESWQPVYSKNRKENWVMIWGRQFKTKRNRVYTDNLIHEMWKFNKEGKADSMLRYNNTLYESIND
jgi:hypothetical protein